MNPSSSNRGSVVGGLCRSGGQEPLVLALLPLDPGACVLAGREPAVDRGPELRVAPQAPREGQLCELDAEARAQVAQRAQPVQLREAVRAVPARGAPGDDEALLLE